MKTGIHPTYYADAKIVCSCGAVFENVGSTVKELRTELCSQCHPFYTGRQKYVDTGGRIEKFEARRSKASRTKNTKTTEGEEKNLAETAAKEENVKIAEVGQEVEVPQKIEKKAAAGSKAKAEKNSAAVKKTAKVPASVKETAVKKATKAKKK